jgi:hypothetical protein
MVKKDVTVLRMVFCFCLVGMLSFPPNSFAGFFDDLVDGGYGYFVGRKKIKEWNEENKGKFIIRETKLGSNTSSFSVNSCAFWGEFTNQTKETVDYIVVKIFIYNKSTKEPVIQEKKRLKISVVPTATIQTKIDFYSSQIVEALQQLKNNWTWNYELIGVVPRGMEPKWLD